MKEKLKMSRVDVQVSIFTAAVVVISFFCVYWFNYTITYRDMIASLEERVTAIYNFVEGSLDKSTFTEINSVADQTKPSYSLMKQELADIKSSTGVMYLYTAKRNDQGQFVYIVDGLPSDSSDFRNAGDLIEEEIIADLEYALQDNIVYPEEIKNTTWGNIFVCYFPVHNNGEVVGVLGIEFQANHQYQTFQLLRIVTPLIAALACLLAVVIAIRLFRRISNPTFQDFANTDQLTGLKNRNAFEVDINNLMGKSNNGGISLISADLNGLKIVNDRLGHQAGDQYIQCGARVLKNATTGKEGVYRVGGDEFAIILYNADDSQIAAMMQSISDNIAFENKLGSRNLSMAIGFARFDEALDDSIFQTYQRADNLMYENKKSRVS